MSEFTVYGMEGSALVITPLLDNGTVDPAADPFMVRRYSEISSEADVDDDETQTRKDTAGVTFATHTSTGEKRGYTLSITFDTFNPEIAMAMYGGTVDGNKFQPRWGAAAANQGKAMVEFYVPNSVTKNFSVYRYFYVVGTTFDSTFNGDDWFTVAYTGTAQVSPDTTKPRIPYEIEHSIAALPNVPDIAVPAPVTP